VQNLSLGNVGLEFCIISFEKYFHIWLSWLPLANVRFKNWPCLCKVEIFRWILLILLFCFVFECVKNLKTDPSSVMSKAIKGLSMSSLLPISFEVEWYNSRSDKWYQSHGHGFEKHECHCEGGIVEGNTIWFLTITLKTDLHGMMSKAIKDLNMSSSSLNGFEVKWHSHCPTNFDTHMIILAHVLFSSLEIMCLSSKRYEMRCLHAWSNSKGKEENSKGWIAKH